MLAGNIQEGDSIQVDFVQEQVKFIKQPFTSPSKKSPHHKNKPIA